MANSVEGAADKAARHQRVIAGMDAWRENPRAYYFDQILSTVVISVLIGIGLTPLAGFDGAVVLASIPLSYVVVRLYEYLKYGYHDFWLNWHRSEMHLTSIKN